VVALAAGVVEEQMAPQPKMLDPVYLAKVLLAQAVFKITEAAVAVEQAQLVAELMAVMVRPHLLREHQ
jgi:hypothetical protein